jgi:hypothetical protein
VVGVGADAGRAPAAGIRTGTGEAGAAVADAGGAGPVEVVADTDGARAARRAIARSGDGRTAVWVGEADEPELEQLRTEIGRRQ